MDIEDIKEALGTFVGLALIALAFYFFVLLPLSIH